MRQVFVGSLLSVLMLFALAAADAVRLQPVFDAGVKEDAAAATRGEELEQTVSQRQIRKRRHHSLRIPPARTLAVFSAEPSRLMPAPLPLIDPHEFLRTLRI